MKKLFARFRRSTFARFALSYICLLVLVLLGIFGYMYTYVEREVRDRVLDSHINRLSRIAYQHEDYMNTMLNTALQMGLSPFIEPFDYATEPARAYDLLRQMAPYTVTNSFCDQIFLSFRQDDHIYSSASSMTLDMFTSLLRYNQVSAQELRELIADPGRLTILPAQRVESSLIDGTQVSVVTFLRPLGVSESNSKGTMLFLVKENVYWALFADAIEDANNTYIFHSGQLMASETDFDLPADVIYQQASNLASGESVSFSLKGENWTLLCTGSRDWDMRYVTVLKTADLTGRIWTDLARLVMLLTGLTAVGILVALLLAKRNVQPIREISSMLSQKRESGDELYTIQTGIRELSARNTDLTTRLERSLPMQRHDFLLRFMKGRYTSREDSVREAAAVGLMIDKPYYAVVLSGVQDHNDQPLDLRLPPFDTVEGTLGCGVELVALSAHMYLIFSHRPEQIRQMAELIREVGLERSGHAIVSLSGIQTDFSQAPNAYLEAAAAYENRFVMDDTRLMDYAEISTSIEDILPKARRITDGINQALLMRNRDMLAGKIGELLHFLKHTSMSPFAFRLIYNDVIAALLREHTQALSEKQDVQDFYDIFSLSSCQRVDDLDELLRRLCDSILSAEKKPETDPPVEEQPGIGQITRYMVDHFTDPELSISAIAEAFNMSTARLSLAFKELTRMSPLEYLTLLRVERSKTLLRDTALSIKEIAAEVGYYDASSFIRRFKQITGVTPLQYRRSKEESGTHADS